MAEREQTTKLKWCNKCKTAKPCEAFSKNCTTKDGLQAWCKTCFQDCIHQHYQQPRNRERRRITLRRYERRPEVKAKKATYMAKYRQRPEVKEHKNALARFRRKTDPEFRERERCKKREYYAEHEEECLERNRRWVEENREAWNIISSRHRARQYSAFPNDFTAEDWEAVLTHYRFCCAYCGVSENLQRDHIVPLSLSGSHTISNIVPACKRCNTTKGARTPSMAGMYLDKLPLARWRL